MGVVALPFSTSHLTPFACTSGTGRSCCAATKCCRLRVPTWATGSSGPGSKGRGKASIDATKAKQLVDLLYTRVHAGEERRVNATEKAKAHEHAVNAGIVASITAFVQALHDASGDGRYPDKVRKAQQVICTAVSKAAVLSSTNTSIREIGAKLGLSERMISKCKVPPTQS